MATRPFHVVVWGATGFTGRLVCERIAKAYPGKIKWAMAGRNKAKLEATRLEISKFSADAANVPILLADLSDKSSLDKMAASTSVVICMAGPYTLYGLPVVQACVDAGTHYCDLAGEGNFVQDSIASFHEAAKTNGCRIVHSCGFDSIPSDITALVLVDYLKQKHKVATDYVECVIRDLRGGLSGGTTESMLTVLKQPRGKLKHVLHPYALVPDKCGKPLKELPDKGWSLAPKFLQLSNTWSGPFIMAPHNEPIVRRSSELLAYGQTFTYTERVAAKGRAGALFSSVVFIALAAMAKMISLFPLLRKIAPLPGSGPSRETMEKGFAVVSGVGVGVSVSPQGSAKAYSIFKLHADPGYLGTALLILETALCLALQPEEIAADRYAGRCPGGVATPAAACGFVLVKRLKEAGVDIGVSDSPDAFTFAKKKIE